MTDARIDVSRPAMDSPAALRIAVVGPTHPDQGEVAAHTTTLAHHLADAGHDVTLVSWAPLHPSRRWSAGPGAAGLGRPGSDEPGPGSRPAGGGAAAYPRTIRALSWVRPDSWVRAGRRLRGVDAVVVVPVLPAGAPAHLALLSAAGALPQGAAGSPASQGLERPQSIVLCHSLIPAHARPGDRQLMASLLRRVDSVVAHSADQGRVAQQLGARRVSVADLPAPAWGDERVGPGAPLGPTRLLALGLPGEHHGIDRLLRAMRDVPGVSLTVAGELWGADRLVVTDLAAHPALAGRVHVRDGLVPADELATLLAGHDVLALPSRSSTASRNVVLAHAHGLPVLACDVPPFSQQVLDGVNGLLVPPDDERALEQALRRLGDPAVRQALADAVHTPDLSGAWANYLGILETLSVDRVGLGASAAERAPASGAAGHPVGDGPPVPTDGPGSRPQPDRAAAPAGEAWTAESTSPPASPRRARRPGRVAAQVTVAGARSLGRAGRMLRRRVRAHRPVLDLRPDELPDWVLASDVLGEPAEADDARRLARLLGLPRVLDSVAAWAALGALAAIIRVRDDGRRSAVIVDESGARSVLSRWARAVGFAPVEIEFTGSHPSVAALDVDAGSLDVIVRIHPRGCDGDDIDHVLEQAAWALRSGGLLIVTVPIGPPSADGAVGPADVRGILARSHDLGFVLVGDLDGDVTARMREAAGRARAHDAAYGLVRLTLRRR